MFTVIITGVLTAIFWSLIIIFRKKTFNTWLGFLIALTMLFTIIFATSGIAAFIVSKDSFAEGYMEDKIKIEYYLEIYSEPDNDEELREYYDYLKRAIEYNEFVYEARDLYEDKWFFWTTYPKDMHENWEKYLIDLGKYPLEFNDKPC